MTTWTVVSLRTASNREARRLEHARRLAQDELAGRTVWCVAALDGGREAAWELRARLRVGGVAVGCIEVSASEPLAALGQRLEAMLHGEARGLSREDGADYASACLDGEAMIGEAVATEDIVVLHDALAAFTAEAARERGAHVVWRIDAAVSPAPRSATEAWGFMVPHAHGVDGFVGDWAGRIGAVVPSTRAVAALDVGRAQVPDAWSGALAELVRDDRHETVGGRVHARPAVAIR